MRTILSAFVVVTTSTLLSGPVWAQGAKPLSKCAPDAVVSGTVCMDKFEASAWRVPGAATINKGLVKKIRSGKATVADLVKGGATQLGLLGAPDYAPCGDGGQNCTNDVFALSLPQVLPSAQVSWFQALAACKNSRKRLPSNAEWQAAALGTPDPGPDDGTTSCNVGGVDAVATLTGSRSGCASADGAFDMVGNLYEWVADWSPRSSAGCNGTWLSSASPTGDHQCYTGAATSGEPGALLRGGSFGFGFGAGASAGPLAVLPRTPSIPDIVIGFRCAR